MANLIRSAKPCSDWTPNDLKAYNITIDAQNAATFFGQSRLPAPAANPQLLTTLSATDMIDDSCFRVVKYMDLSMDPVPGEESAVSDFAMELLKAIGYDSRDRFLRSRKDIPLFICGTWSHTTADVCLMDDKEIILLVQEDKRHLEWGDPRPQLIAKVIAAAQTNNTIRETVLNLAPLEYELMAGITMTGTSPTFFKIPITSELMEAVRLGQYPPTPTVVMMHLPEVRRPARRLSEGMRPLDSRGKILACFQAFKQGGFLVLARVWKTNQ